MFWAKMYNIWFQGIYFHVTHINPMHQSISDSKPQVKSMLAVNRRLSFSQLKLNLTAIY